MRAYDIVALGELLVDMTPAGVGENGNPAFEANPGGAPCNVLAMARNMGSRCAFVGRVGMDSFGDSLAATLEGLGISTAGLSRDPAIPTTLAFVHLGEDGERSFTFYRKPGADLMLSREHVDQNLIRNARIFHFGTLSLVDDPARDATRYAVEIARESGCIISFDPNVRRPLWNSRSAMLEQIKYGLSVCHVLKISDEEAKLVTGEKKPQKALEKLREDYPSIRVIFLTMGSEGCLYYMKGQTGQSSATKPARPVVDTTGAGDTFFGCCLHFLAQKERLEDVRWSDLERMVRWAGGAAALVITRKGSMTVMPTRSELGMFVQDVEF